MELSTQARPLKLYRLLQTRTNGYKVLQTTLEKAKQSGASQILANIRHSKNKQSSQKNARPKNNIVENFYRGEMENKIKQYDTINDENITKIHQKACNEIESLCLETKLVEGNEWNNIEKKLNDMFLKIDWHNIEDKPILPSDATPTIGIDLGTKNCVAALFIEDRVKIIEFLSKNSFSSYVSFENDGTSVIGNPAKRNAFVNAENTIFDSKRLLGRDSRDPKLDNNISYPFKLDSRNGRQVIYAQGRKYFPEEISAMLLKHCKTEGEKLLGTEITKAVITVPAYFNNHQREATLEAGKIAGLEVIHLLNEPVAAVIAYRQERVNKKASKILVFDVGGGTFDVAVIELQEKCIQVESIGGDAFLGGEDIDSILANYCLDIFSPKSKGILGTKKHTKYDARSLVTLKENCEQVKVELGSLPTSRVLVPNFYKGEDLNVTISREKFEELINPMLEKMMQIVRETLRNSNTSVMEIEDILLIGGTTYIPKLQSELGKLFHGRRLCNAVNPETAVAYGAAVKAALLTCKSSRKSLDLEAIQDVIPMSIGIEAKIDDMVGRFSVIIPSNCKYPCEKSYNYRTTEDFQDTARISIYQGNAYMAKENTHLGVFVLSGIPSKKKGEEKIVVKMVINDLGILVVTASCSNGSNKLQVENIKI